MSKFQLTVHFESAADLYAFASVLPGAHTPPVSADDIVRAFGGIVPPQSAAIDDNSPSELDIDPTTAASYVAAAARATIAPEDNPSAGLPSPTEMVAAAAAVTVVTPTPPAPPAALDTAAIFGKVPSAAPLVPTPPAPAPAPAAPAAPTPPTAATAPTAAPGVELDSKGLPWDGRIHSETRNKIADGSWRKRRGVADELVQSVEAQLRALLGANAAAAATTVTATTLVQPVLPPAAEPPAPPVVTAPAAPAASVTPLPPAATVAAPPAPQPPAPAPAAAPTASPSSNPVGDFMLKSAELISAGKLTMTRVTEVCQKHGLANLAQLVMAPNLLPAIEAELLS